jgi:hypothetical protein
MDNIDITDSAFSLDIPSNSIDINSTIGITSQNNYMMYIYIGIASLILLGGIYIFKMYQAKKNSQTNENSLDCPGGFCMMNEKQN